MDERIICASICYKELPLIRNDIPSNLFRPKNISVGIVFSGHRHVHCLYQMVVMTGKRQDEAGEEVQGLLTNLNRFVDRYEAAEIALKCGQIEKLNYGSRLFSEDLY